MVIGLGNERPHGRFAFAPPAPQSGGPRDGGKRNAGETPLQLDNDSRDAALETYAMIPKTNKTADILGEVYRERRRQDEKFGQQDHGDGLRLAVAPSFDLPYATVHDLSAFLERVGRSLLTPDPDGGGGTGTVNSWAGILLEEVGEALQACGRDHLREELVQVAAVAVSWVEAIDRRPVSGCWCGGSQDCDGESI